MLTAFDGSVEKTYDLTTTVPETLTVQGVDTFFFKVKTIVGHINVGTGLADRRTVLPSTHGHPRHPPQGITIMP